MPRLRAVLQNAASGHDSNPQAIFISVTQQPPYLERPGKGTLDAPETSRDNYGKPLWAPPAARLSGRGLDACAGSGQRVLGGSLELPNRVALLCARTATAASLNRSQAHEAPPL